MNTCKICNNSNLNKVIDFGDVPLAGYLVKSKDESLSELRYNNSLVYCSTCCHVQQGDREFYSALIDKVYSNYQSTYSMSSHVRKYMLSFLDFSLQLANIKSGIVLEIGSNDGSMFKILRDKGFTPAGIDPSAVVNGHEADSIIVQDFFQLMLHQNS